MEIAEFLLARIAEDEAAVHKGAEPDVFDAAPTYYTGFGAHRDDWGLWTFNVPPARVLAECEAKRRVVELTEAASPPDLDPIAEHHAGNDGPWVGSVTLKLLALPYAEHPDYDPEWKV